MEKTRDKKIYIGFFRGRGGERPITMGFKLDRTNLGYASPN